MKKLLTLGLAVPLSLFAANAVSANEEVSTSEVQPQVSEFTFENGGKDVHLKIEETETDAKITIVEDGVTKEGFLNKKTEELKFDGKIIDVETELDSSLEKVVDGDISINNITPGGGGNGTLLDYNSGSIGVKNLNTTAIVIQIAAGLLNNGYFNALSALVSGLVMSNQDVNWVWYTEYIWEVPDPAFNWKTRKQYDLVWYSDVNRTKKIGSGSFYM